MDTMVLVYVVRDHEPTLIAGAKSAEEALDALFEMVDDGSLDELVGRPGPGTFIMSHAVPVLASQQQILGEIKGTGLILLIARQSAGVWVWCTAGDFAEHLPHHVTDQLH